MTSGRARMGPLAARIALWAALAQLGWPAPALGHDPTGSGGLFSGLAHPISGLDHVLAMVAVGLWGAQLGAPALWVLPVAFPMLMAVGGTAGLLGVPLPFVEIGVALSAVVLGVLLLIESRPPLWLATIVVGVFAVCHGHAHGSELPAGESGVLFSIGFVVATGCLHAAGIGLGELLRRAGPRGWSLRSSGVPVAIGGLYFLGRAFGGW